ncbi:MULTISPECIES: tetratricopeptide repeat protein [unclassified Leptolyngbya]|uniref:tetratricopeptide repeat protein n=1 Tax=unclassified Leptolyngbya TaxID=2650499 RepID=UPI001688EA4A|nr:MULTISPECIES: tetratricopeptide repeat protein [unclassified Leptolyngbya]MBD1909523.1 hypothetical protein [Leptolyngbya sp. FACHB-8]MBD2154631.1 hypothetical protein [Leptolyngbya sp. FACHB-16]
MNDAPLDEIEIRNREALEELAQTIEWSVGEFHLLLARCNYGNVRSHLITRLQEICPVRIQVVTLTNEAEKLYTTIREAMTDQDPEAVLVIGFEHVRDLDKLFAAADSAREEFRKNFAFPLVFWLDDSQFNGFKNRAPNFESWAPVDTPVFAIAPFAILQSLEQGCHAIFKAAFNPEEKDLPDAIGRITHLGDLQRSELPNALQFLEDQGIGLRADLQADLDFIQGCHLSRRNSATLEALEAAIEFFQNTIIHYRTYLPTILVAPNAPVPQSLSNLKLGLALFFLGRCQFQQIDLARRTSYLPYKQADWEVARASLTEAVLLFDQCDRPDMSAKIILRLLRTLRRLEDWGALEEMSRRAISLHATYDMPTRAGEPYGFLAEAALDRKQWAQARDYAQQALQVIAPLGWPYHWPEGLYLSFQARAEAEMGNVEEAIALLEQAQELGDRGHPTTYCRTLEALRELYWQQKRYLDAFKLKQARLEVEKIAGIRAFVGAGRLGAQARLLTEANNPDDLAPEIRVSGRQLDLQRLLERIGRNDFKLTVIHGSSGVGKSSLMNAGLIPTLKGRAIGTRENRVVLVRKYTDWTGDLSVQAAEVLAVRSSQLPEPLTSTLNQAFFTVVSAKSSNHAQADSQPELQKRMLDYVLQQLRECDNQNLRPILIFDQFEEFFFANPNAIDRRRFFEFLGDCLQIPFINVILSLREDYIHYLLEANKVKGLGAIGSDILSNNVLYGLGNFSPTDAKAIIEDLTRRSRLYLEPELINALVNDLAGELQEVRPIELQVVGTQLETEGIHTLADYHALGPKPKEELVTRYLQEVVQDCGEEYAALSARVLYELTDERGTRPLKTRPELLRELETADFPLPAPPTDLSTHPIKHFKDSLDYVLRMLSGSGLVTYLPEQPDDRYQLIHDYIAEAIRKKYAPGRQGLLKPFEQSETLSLKSEVQQATLAERQDHDEQTQKTTETLEEAHKLRFKAERRLKIASGVLGLSLLSLLLALVVSMAMVSKERKQEAQANNIRSQQRF